MRLASAPVAWVSVVRLSSIPLVTIVYMIPKMLPEHMRIPVEKLSPIGQVSSTPKSIAMDRTGRPTIPQKKVRNMVRPTFFSLNKIQSRQQKIADPVQMTETTALQFWVLATQMPITTVPTIPPTTNIAPKVLPYFMSYPYCYVRVPKLPPIVLKTPIICPNEIMSKQKFLCLKQSLVACHRQFSDVSSERVKAFKLGGLDGWFLKKTRVKINMKMDEPAWIQRTLTMFA